MTPDRLRDALDAGIPGCLWIIRFDAQGYASPGRFEDFDSLGKPREGFVWLHMDLTDVRTRPLIGRIEALSDSAREALRDPVDHQYLEYSEGLVSGALLDHERTLSGTVAHTNYVRFAIGDSFLVTARRSPMSCVEATRNALGRGVAAASPFALFEIMANALVDDMVRMTQEIGAAFDHAEDLIIDSRGRAARPFLGRARRDAVRLSRQVGGLVSTLARLEAIEDDPDEATDNALRETASRLVQHTESLAREMTSIQERARLLQDELNAILNLETNDRLFALTVVTILLLPATFVTGYFGMNTDNLLFTGNGNGTLYATIMCFAASALALVLMRWLGLTNPNEGEDASRPHDAVRHSRPADHNL
ncbi:MAG: magnesium transporter CorA [Methylocystis sp.]|nr:MAG: magnesium transporter CorA [Methylocystis sp.]